MKEAAAGDSVEEEAVGENPGGAVDGADVGGVDWSGGRGFAGGKVGIGGGEGGEVVGAEDGVGGVLEQSEVELEGTVPDEGREHGGADKRHGVGDRGEGQGARGEDAVLVGLADGAVTGVEAGGGGFKGENTDGGG